MSKQAHSSYVAQQVPADRQALVSLATGSAGNETARQLAVNVLMEDRRQSASGWMKIVNRRKS